MWSRYFLLPAAVLLVTTIATNGFAFAVGNANGEFFRLGLLWSAGSSIVAAITEHRRSNMVYAFAAMIIIVALLWLILVIRLPGL